MPRAARQLVVLLLVSLALSAQSLPKFMGREVTMTVPELDPTGFFPQGPATVCVEGQQRQCYTAPKDFGRSPEIAVVQVDKRVSALFFSAASGGVSGFGIHFALLRPGTGKDLEDLFLSGIEVSNQSEHSFWTDLSISNAKIFVTAEYVWGPDEAHYSDHRYMISAYVCRHSDDREDESYYLDDRYMTSRKYESDDKTNILGSERQEIISRLRRAKLQRRPPH